jgi:thiamine-phosphate pyrophosphorylase
MADADDKRCRLCLVTSPDMDVATSARLLSDALSGGDVASLIIAADRGDPARLQRAAEALVPIAQARGVAAIVHNDTRVVGRTQADGVHVDTGLDDLEAAIAALHPGRIVGAGGLTSRHDAMLVGELEPDYLFFGRLDGDTGDGIFAKAFDLAEWWSSVAVIPAIVMGGRALASVSQAAAAGIEFVALSRAIWDDPRGPARAVADACQRLAAIRERAA